MEISNRIVLTFGPAGSFAGYVLLIVGLLTLNSWVGIILILLGLFFAFSFSGTTIDRKNNKYRQYTKIFGLFKVGDWEELSKFTGITYLINNSSFRVFSGGNRSIDTKQNNYLIYLVGADNRTKIVVMKCKTKELAKTESKKLSEILNLPVFDSDE